MATSIVSGRVDSVINQRASSYIHAAGLTVSDVIGMLWNCIAQNKQVPDFLMQAETQEADSLAQFFEFCDSLEPLPDTEWISNIDDEQMKKLITDHLEDKYA